MNNKSINRWVGSPWFSQSLGYLVTSLSVSCACQPHSALRCSTKFVVYLICHLSVISMRHPCLLFMWIGASGSWRHFPQQGFSQKIQSWHRNCRAQPAARAVSDLFWPGQLSCPVTLFSTQVKYEQGVQLHGGVSHRFFQTVRNKHCKQKQNTNKNKQIDMQNETRKNEKQ